MHVKIVLTVTHGNMQLALHIQRAQYLQPTADQKYSEKKKFQEVPKGKTYYAPATIYNLEKI